VGVQFEAEWARYLNHNPDLVTVQDIRTGVYVFAGLMSSSLSHGVIPAGISEGDLCVAVITT
jgi:hypothetical protein